MRVPANLIKFNYTSGNEYAYALSYKYYTGSYYELNGKYYAGKEFNINAPELIKVSRFNVNTLLTQAATFAYGYISKKKIDNSKPKSFIYDNKDINRYFLAKINTVPTLIKEVDKDTYQKFSSNPLYKSVALLYDGGFSEKELNEAEKKIPGIKTFANTSYLPPSTEESGLVG